MIRCTPLQTMILPDAWLLTTWHLQCLVRSLPYRTFTTTSMTLMISLCTESNAILKLKKVYSYERTNLLAIGCPMQILFCGKRAKTPPFRGSFLFAQKLRFKYHLQVPKWRFSGYFALFRKKFFSKYLEYEFCL